MRTILAGIIALGAWGAGACQAAAADLRVVVTVKPIHSLVAAVMAGVGEPKLLIDGNRSPHTFVLKPSDTKALHTADVVLRVSDTLEPFMIKVLKSLPKTVRVVTLAEVPDLTLYAMRMGGTFEEHAHEKGGSHAGHSHGKSGHNHGKGQEEKGQDGHIWLDPANAKLIATHIAAVLATEAPEHADRFKANASRAYSEARCAVGGARARSEAAGGQGLCRLSRRLSVSRAALRPRLLSGRSPSARTSRRAPSG